MLILYADESGDTGLAGSPTQHFILSGLVVHERDWRITLDRLVSLRGLWKTRDGFKLREELHASAMINKPGDLKRIAKWRRLRILREALEFQANQHHLSVVTIHVDKTTKGPGYDVFDNAWKALIQRFDNTIRYKNFPGSKHNTEDMGLLITDQTDEHKLRGIVRKARRYNPIPSKISGYRQMPFSKIVEDPVPRDSMHSYFLQLADANAFFYKQKINPCGYITKKGAQNYFDRLNPVLCKVASSNNPQGVVQL